MQYGADREVQLPDCDSKAEAGRGQGKRGLVPPAGAGAAPCAARSLSTLLPRRTAPAHRGDGTKTQQVKFGCAENQAARHRAPNVYVYPLYVKSEHWG